MLLVLTKSKQGFIAIEMMIVIVALTAITSLSLIQVKHLEQSMIADKEIELLQSVIVNARNLAMTTKNNVTMDFSNNQVIIDNNQASTYVFKHIQFLNNKSLYYNQRGNINHAYTLQFNHLNQLHTLVFYLGKGWFKIE